MTRRQDVKDSFRLVWLPEAVGYPGRIHGVERSAVRIRKKKDHLGGPLRDTDLVGGAKGDRTPDLMTARLGH